MPDSVVKVNDEYYAAGTEPKSSQSSTESSSSSDQNETSTSAETTEVPDEYDTEAGF